MASKKTIYLGPSSNVPGRANANLKNQAFAGVGTELKNVLGWFGLSDAFCGTCKAHADTMDLRGIDWCERNQAEIVGWLREGAAKRSLPFFEAPAYAALQLAINRAKRNRDAAAPATTDARRVEGSPAGRAESPAAAKARPPQGE
jgi:hypothetical protein